MWQSWVALLCVVGSLVAKEWLDRRRAAFTSAQLRDALAQARLSSAEVRAIREAVQLAMQKVYGPRDP